MRAILHVGPHKTGTTSFQLACHHAYNRLLDERILYPQEGVAQKTKAFPVCHTEVAVALSTGRIDDVHQYLERCKSTALRYGADTVLLSSEEFSSLVWTEGSLAKLDYLLSKAFEHHEYVLVLRRIRESFPSTLRQLVTHFSVDLYNPYNLDQKLEAVAMVLDCFLKEVGQSTRTVRFEELCSGNLAWNLLRFCVDDDIRTARIKLADVRANASDTMAKELFALITPLLRALISIDNGYVNPYTNIVEQELSKLFKKDCTQDILQKDVSLSEISELVSRALHKLSDDIVARNLEHIAGRYPRLREMRVLD